MNEVAGNAGAAPQCWVVVAARDDVEAAVAGGYVEVNHGKSRPLSRMQPGDGIACYSPRSTYPKGARLQAFTAIGRVADTCVAQSGEGHQPFRRAVAWLPCTPAPVKPMLDALTFVRNREYWGTAFRFGFLRIPAADFDRIAAARGCPLRLAHARAGAPTSGSVAPPDASMAHAQPLPARPSRARRRRIDAEPVAAVASAPEVAR